MTVNGDNSSLSPFKILLFLLLLGAWIMANLLLWVRSNCTFNALNEGSLPLWPPFFLSSWLSRFVRSNLRLNLDDFGCMISEGVKVGVWYVPGVLLLVPVPRSVDEFSQTYGVGPLGLVRVVKRRG